MKRNRKKPVNLKEYFRPGRIVPSYAGYYRVIALYDADTPNWYVDVQAVLPVSPASVISATDAWEIDPRYPMPRRHCTRPTSHDIAIAYFVDEDKPKEAPHA